jgi:hypothetical protein
MNSVCATLKKKYIQNAVFLRDYTLREFFVLNCLGQCHAGYSWQCDDIITMTWCGPLILEMICSDDVHCLSMSILPSSYRGDVCYLVDKKMVKKVMNKILGSPLFQQKWWAVQFCCSPGTRFGPWKFSIILLKVLTLSVRTEYIYSVASQATSPAPFKYLFNKYPYWIF